MNDAEAVDILEKAKKQKIAFCKKHRLPIPAFDKAEDYKIDDKIPCPKCGSIEGYMSKGTFTQLYDAAGNPDGYTFDGDESVTVKCINCGSRFKRERLWKES